MLLPACAAGQPAVPADAPYLTGTITAVEAAPRLIRVEELPGAQDSGGAKAAVRITERTRVLRQAAGIDAATADELQVGRRASIWFEGPVAESYPVQGDAATVLILPR